MVKLLVLLLSFAIADPGQIWRESLQNSLPSTTRITFGQVDINGSESAAIAAAKIAARAEMAKSFKVKVKTASVHEMSYQQTRAKTDSAKSAFSSITQESTDEVELVGLDLTKFQVDLDKKTVQAAAILNLGEFEKYLIQKAQTALGSISHPKEKTACKTVADIRLQRKNMNAAIEAKKYEDLLLVFSDKSMTAEKTMLKELDLTMTCRKSLYVSTSGISTSDRPVANQVIKASGFSLIQENVRRLANIPAIKFSSHKILSDPEIKFGRVNITGKVEITLLLVDDETFTWSSSTIRQADADAETAKMKLDIRLNDQISEGITALLEENL